MTDCNSDQEFFVYVLPISGGAIVCHLALLQEVFDQDGEFTSIIEVFQTILLEYSGMTPLSIMSQIIFSITMEDSDLQKDKIRLMLDILPAISKGKIYLPWLFGTRNWIIEFTGVSGDLFSLFEEF